MTELISRLAGLVVPAAFLCVALGFLLLGYRLGRESVGRPMFDFTASPPEPEAPPAMDDDPWDEVFRVPDRRSGPGGMDKNETGRAGWPFGGGDFP